MVSMDAPNPWGLRPFEARTIDAICDHDSAKSAAKALGVTPKTLEGYMCNVREKMGGRRIHCMALWMRHRDNNR